MLFLVGDEKERKKENHVNTFYYIPWHRKITDL